MGAGVGEGVGAAAAPDGSGPDGEARPTERPITRTTTATRTAPKIAARLLQELLPLSTGSFGIGLASTSRKGGAWRGGPSTLSRSTSVEA